jgi:hypothetical protein
LARAMILVSKKLLREIWLAESFRTTRRRRIRVIASDGKAIQQV